MSFLLKLITACSMRAIADCTVTWLNKTNVHSFGATRHTDGVTSATDCLNFCATTSSCVAVDIDYTHWPVRCWVYNDPYRLYFTAPLRGVVQYRVMSRSCQNSNSPTCTYTRLVCCIEALNPLKPNSSNC